MAILGAAIGVQHLPQAPLGKALVDGTRGRRHVVTVAHVQIGVRVGDADQAIECIVVIGGGDATRIGGRLAVAGGVHGEAAGATIRADLPGQVTEPVVGVCGLQALRVGDLGDLVQRVVLAADLRRHAADVLQGLGQSVERVVLLAGHALQGVGHGLRVAIGIVGKAGGVIPCVLQHGQLAERVERACQGTLPPAMAADYALLTGQLDAPGAQTPRTMPDVPVALLTATQLAAEPLFFEETAAGKALWKAQHALLFSGFTRGSHRYLSTGHTLQREDPASVVAAIQSVAGILK